MVTFSDIIYIMSVRKIENTNFEVGNIIRRYREALVDLPKSRKGFIDNRSQIYFGCEEWISEKSLSNYENGKNIPSLEMIKKLAIAMEVDELQFVAELLNCL